MALVALDPLPQFDGPQGVTVAGDFSATSENFEDPHVLKLHKPHAFALMHGDGGAKVAYGQLLWRRDKLQFDFDTIGSSVAVIRAGQPATIDAPKVVIPKVNSANGESMDPTIPNVYHQLDDYGDVYLYWKAQTNDSAFFNVTDAWVQVSADDQDPSPLANIPQGDTDHDITENIAPGFASTAEYRVKIGTVEEGQLIKQELSSDMYWSIAFITRERL